MSKIQNLLLFMLFVHLAELGAVEGQPTKPNLLFIIADDASLHFGAAYGCTWVKTPNIDRLSSKGLIFDNAYTPTGKCSPSRSAILTGRNPWQLEDAANHWPTFPEKYFTYSEALKQAGIHISGQGKIWGPGTAKTADGKPRDFGFSSAEREFAAFLKSRPAGKPFFYWYGSHRPHRPYKQGSGLASGKKLTDIDRVPGIWPDNETVRSDMLDYALAIEMFDEEVGRLLKALEASGEAQNTLVLVTSDNGMPFPRSKGHNYDISNHEPLIAYWPGVIKEQKRVAEFVSFIDFAPTILELFGVDGAKAGMAPITGRSFVNVLRGEADPARSFVILGRERNDVQARPGTPSGLGYPVRAIREGEWFYIHNYAAERWPCGNVDLGLKDTDGGPTKGYIENLGELERFWQLAFGKRPEDELFDLTKDPDCVNNLANDPAYANKVSALREKLNAELKKQDDPRVLGKGDQFDQYNSPKLKAEKAVHEK